MNEEGISTYCGAGLSGDTKACVECGTNTREQPAATGRNKNAERKLQDVLSEQERKGIYIIPGIYKVPKEIVSELKEKGIYIIPYVCVL